MNDLQKLYDVLVREGYFTKSFGEFTDKFKDSDYQNKVYETVSRDGLFTKSKDDFLGKYSPSLSTSAEAAPAPSAKPATPAAPAPAQPDKKKVATALPSAASLSESVSTRPTEPTIATRKPQTTAFGTVGASKPQPSTAAFTKPVAPEPESISGPVEKDMSVSREVSIRPAEPITPKPTAPPTPTSEANDYFSKSLDIVKSDLIGLPEGSVVPKLNYTFGQYGFKFDEATAMFDEVKVTAPNGQTEIFKLDNFTTDADSAEALRLKKFISENRPTSKLLSAKEGQFAKPILEEKDIESNVASLNTDITSLNKDADEYIKLKAQLEAQAPNVQSMSPEQKDAFLKASNVLEMKRIDITRRDEMIKSKSKSLDAEVGKYTAMKAESGSFGGALQNTILGIFDDFNASVTRGISTLQEAVGIDNPVSRANAAAVKYLPNYRAPLKAMVGSQVTDEYKESLPLLGQVALGIVESAPAMIAGGVPFSVMQYSAKGYDELDKTDLGEGEKAIYATALAIPAALLEKVGFGNVFSEKLLLNGLLKRVLPKLGVNATFKTASEFIEQDIKNLMARGVLRIGAAGAAEFETGAIEEIIDIGGKELIEGLKEKELFKTPENFSQGLSQVIEAGAMEAVGGFMLGSIGASAKAYKENKFENLLDGQVDFLSKISSDPALISSYKAKINEAVANGDKTQAQADEEIASFDKMVGQLRSIPKDISPAGQKEALRLLKERDSLQAKIDISDPDLVTKEKARVAEIKEKLQKISTDYAVQESSTEESVLRDEEPQVGLQEMGEGDTEVQAPAEEVAKEEVTAEPLEQKSSRLLDAIDTARQAGADGVDALNSALANLRGIASERVKQIGNRIDDLQQKVRDLTKSSTVPSATLSDLVGKQVNYNGESGTLNVSEGGAVTFETPNKIVEIENATPTSMASDFNIAAPKPAMEITPTTDRFIDNDNVVINNVEYGIQADNNGNVVGLQLKDGSNQVLTNPQLLVKAEAIRNTEGKVAITTETTITPEAQSQIDALNGQIDALTNERGRIEQETKTNEERVAEYRAQEIAEFRKNVEGAESFIVNGKIDSEKVKASDNAKAKEIYSKYDKLIAPLLAATEATPTAAEKRFAGNVLAATRVVAEDLAKLVAILTKANRNVKVITDKAKMVAFLVEKGLSPEQANQVKGVRIGDTVYINPELATVDTPIHEFAHIWGELCKKQRPELWKRGISLITKSNYYKDLLAKIKADPNMSKLYPTPEAIKEEALIQAIGERGATIFDDNKLQLMWNNWVASFDNFIKKVLGLPMTADITKIKLSEFLDMAATEVLTGKSTGVGGEMTIEKTKAAKDFEVQINAWQAQQSPVQLAKIINDAIKAKLTKTQIVDILVKRGGLTSAEASQVYNDVKAKNPVSIATTGTTPAATTTTVKPKTKFVDGISDAIEQMAGGNLAPEVKDAITDALNKGREAVRLAQITEREMKKQLVDMLKDFVRKGTFTQKEILPMMRRIAGLNAFNSMAVDNFVNFMVNKFETSEAKAKDREVRAKVKNARKNIKSKIGVAKDVMPTLRRLFALNPRIIPPSVRDIYNELVIEFGERAGVLSLSNINDVAAKANQILQEAIGEQNQALLLKDLFDNFANKVLDANGDVDYAKTIKQMIDDGVIQTADEDIMKRQKKLIFESASRKKTEAEIEAERVANIDVARNTPVDVTDIQTREERDDANELVKLINSDAVNTLSPSQAAMLPLIIDNINNGWFPSVGKSLIATMNGISAGNQIADIVMSKAKAGVLNKLLSSPKTIFKQGTSAIKEFSRGKTLQYIDRALGITNARPIYDLAIKRVAEAYTAYKTSYKIYEQKIDKASNEVFKSLGRSRNALAESSYKQMTYMLQREYLSNIGMKGVSPVTEVIDATIKKLKQQNRFADAKMLEDIKEKYTVNGEFDNDLLYNSFNKAEKNSIDVITEVNNDLTSDALYTASVIRGDASPMYRNYIHHDVLTDGSNAMQGFNAATSAHNPSTKAASLIARKGGPQPLNFDVFSAVKRSSRNVLLDFNMTQQMRTTNKAMNAMVEKVVNDPNATKDQIAIATAIKDNVEEVVKDVFMGAYNESTMLDEAIDYITKSGYRTMLAGVRSGAELLSNFAAVMYNPRGFAKGVSIMRTSTDFDPVAVMRNVRSSEIERLYSSDPLTGKFVDSNAVSSKVGAKSEGRTNIVVNKINQLRDYTTRPVRNKVEAVADFLISAPDKVVMRPHWFGSFASEFKKITGVEPDFEKIAANDEAYINQYKESLDKAKDRADKMSVFIGASDNPFKGILKNTIRESDSAAVKGYKRFNSFMTRFLVFEYSTARAAITSMFGRGELTRSEGAALLAAITIRMIGYQMLYTALSEQFQNIIIELFGGEEPEEDDRDFAEKLQRSTLSAFANLAVGRDLGNASKAILNYGIEQFNEGYLEDLRDGREYDKYKDNLVYSPVPLELASKEGGKAYGLDDAIISLSGPLSPLMRTAQKGLELLGQEERKEYYARERQVRNLEERIPLEIIGHLGFVPFYKDLRAALIKDINRTLKFDESGGGITKDELKKYDPDFYQEIYGEEEEAKAEDAEAKDLKEQKKADRDELLKEIYGDN